MTQLDDLTLSGDPGEFIAAIPGWLTYFPDESLVLAGLTDDTPRKVWYLHRVDLSEPVHVSDIMEAARVATTSRGVEDVELLVVAGAPTDSSDLPHRDLVTDLTRGLQDLGITVGRSLWAERIERGRTWRSYTDPTATGLVADPTQFTPDGTEVFASREDFTAQLDPAPEAVLSHRSALLQALPPVCPDRGLTLVRTVIDRIAAYKDPDQRVPLELDDATIVQMGHALTHPDVWYPCLQFALTDRADPAGWLWALLTNAVPRSIVGYPACLFAVSAYLWGNPLAPEAIDMALNANPDLELTEHFYALMHCGVPIDTFREMLTDAFCGFQRNPNDDRFPNSCSYSESP